MNEEVRCSTTVNTSSTTNSDGSTTQTTTTTTTFDCDTPQELAQFHALMNAVGMGCRTYIYK
jgi:hypothetical protein